MNRFKSLNWNELIGIQVWIERVWLELDSKDRIGRIRMGYIRSEKSQPVSDKGQERSVSLQKYLCKLALLLPEAMTQKTEVKSRWPCQSWN